MKITYHVKYGEGGRTVVCIAKKGGRVVHFTGTTVVGEPANPTTTRKIVRECKRQVRRMAKDGTLK